MELRENSVAPNKSEVEALERRISLFVTQALMPMVKRTGALVVCGGTTMCSLCSAIGKEFAALNNSDKAEGAGKFAEHGESKLSSTGRSADSQMSPSSGGGPRPRLLCIVRAPNVAAKMKTPGSNAFSLVNAAKNKSGGLQSHFLSSSYEETFLQHANGTDREAWMQYDIIEGATDVIMVDCMDKRTRWKDYGAHAYFENTFANTFTRNIPNLAIQFGAPLHDENLDGLGGIISKGQQVLVLDSRPRKCLVRPKLRGKSFVNEIPEGNVALTSNILLSHALDDFAKLLSKER